MVEGIHIVLIPHLACDGAIWLTVAPLVDVALLSELARWDSVSTFRCAVRLRDFTGCQTCPSEVVQVVSMSSQGPAVAESFLCFGILGNARNSQQIICEKLMQRGLAAAGRSGKERRNGCGPAMVFFLLDRNPCAFMVQPAYTCHEALTQSF